MLAHVDLGEAPLAYLAADDKLADRVVARSSPPKGRRRRVSWFGHIFSLWCLTWDRKARQDGCGSPVGLSGRDARSSCVGRHVHLALMGLGGMVDRGMHKAEVEE